MQKRVSSIGGNVSCELPSRCRRVRVFPGKRFLANDSRSSEWWSERLYAGRGAFDSKGRSRSTFLQCKLQTQRGMRALVKV